MSTLLPVFAQSENQAKNKQINELIDSLTVEGIHCVRIFIRAKGAYPKALKGGFLPQETQQRVNKELNNPTDPKSAPFPAFTSTNLELAKKVAAIKRKLVRGFAERLSRSEFFTSESQFQSIQEEFAEIQQWLEEQKLLLVSLHPLAEKEWNAKVESAISFLSNKKINGEPEYAEDHLESLRFQWSNLFPEKSAITAMSVSMISFKINSVKETIQDEMVQRAVYELYEVFSSSVVNAAEEVNQELEKCLDIIVNGSAKDRRASRGAFLSLENTLSKVKGLLYGGDNDIQQLLGDVLNMKQLDLAKAPKERLNQIEISLRSLKDKSLNASKKAEKVMGKGHISSVDVSTIPIFD